MLLQRFHRFRTKPMLDAAHLSPPARQKIFNERIKKLRGIYRKNDTGGEPALHTAARVPCRLLLGASLLAATLKIPLDSGPRPRVS